MNLLPSFQWLRAPANRDLIARWTPKGGEPDYRVELPGSADLEGYEFLVLGDTGDAALSGSRVSPQDAVAAELARDAALPGSRGSARAVLHTGDVVYMSGERRLYDRNFRRPYDAFLTPESTFDNLVFRLPFLPVPGNHDYYDFPRWAGALVRAPILGTVFRALSRELFAFSLPQGGSGEGRAYMEAFVDGRHGPESDYRPGERTRLPNRYYRFGLGPVDFFALDSNTLEIPPPSADGGEVRAEAARHLDQLKAQSRTLDHQIRKLERVVERWQAEQRRAFAGNRARLQAAARSAREVSAALARAAQASKPAEPERQEIASSQAQRAAAIWADGSRRLEQASSVAGGARALERLIAGLERGHEVQRALEECLVHLPEGVARRDLIEAERGLDSALRAFGALACEPAPEVLRDRLRGLSEAALEAQRGLATERRRSAFRAEDHDAGQLAWLDRSLAESEREHPDHWRVVYLHHPLCTTIRNYCENSEIRSVRQNLTPLLRGRVHAVFSGHAHAFEWLRCGALPHTGLFVTGGGGQATLGRSVLDPDRIARHRERYRSLRNADLQEGAIAGRGPAASDGESGALYHYLRVEVTRDALFVRPVGVRRRAIGYRRESPMPVHHASVLHPAGPDWRVRTLEAIEIRRGQAPKARWA